MRLSVGNIGNAWSFMMIFMFLPDYLINNIFVGHDLANTLGFSVITISFTVGAFTYLFAGYISDKTRTRWGKRRPYFLLVIPAGISYFLLGLIPASSSVISTFIIVTIIATVYAVLDRIQYCNFWSLYMDLTNPEERVTTSVIFNLFGLIGVVGALFLTPLLNEFIPFNTIILIVGVIYMGTVLFAFYFGPREDPEKVQQEVERSYFTSLKETIRDKNFSIYLIATFLFVNGYSISVLVLIPFLKVHTIQLVYMLIALLPVALLYFVLFDRLAKKRGRLPAFKLAILFGIATLPLCMFLGLVGSGAALFLQVFLIIVLVLNVLISVLTFQYAILMDLTPPGKEATYAGLFMFMIVIPIPISSAIVGPLLDFLAIDFFIWHGETLSYAIIFLITAIWLAISYLFLRKIRLKEEPP